MANTLNPLLSIIIPCYNHSRYLASAIRSCLNLAYFNLEIIVVDDGSVDNTAEVARSFKDVVYIHKENAGLPAARNTGIDHCHGDFISFLDADDWYLPQALLTNLELLRQDPDAAFISGCHLIQQEDGTYIRHCHFHKDKFFIHLLHTNFIGNPSTVIYRRETLKKYRFSISTAYKGCEDYEQYLRITKDNPVLHNPVNISVYRKHESNMSNNYAMMLNSALNVLLLQKPLLRNKEEWIAWKEGWNKWVEFYGYFPVKTNKGRKLTMVNWELFVKYKFSFPLIVWKKIQSMLNPKAPVSGTTIADIYQP
jgi:glycosyltransferase involved in cell wall biosynthesis